MGVEEAAEAGGVVVLQEFIAEAGGDEHGVAAVTGVGGDDDFLAVVFCEELREFFDPLGTEGGLVAEDDEEASAGMGKRCEGAADGVEHF